MNHHFARIVLLIPLLWLIGLSTVFAGSKARQAAAYNKAGATDYYGTPIAKLGTPGKTVEVYMVSASEQSQWTYVVVTNDADEGTLQRYGDDQTVGRVLRGLSKDLHVASKDRSALRCPAAETWGFENTSGHVSFCNHTADATRIEQAISLLELAPTTN